MSTPPEPQPRHKRYSARHQARPDEETHGKLQALAKTLHKRRALILRHVMQWGIDHGKDWTIDPSIPTESRLIHLLVEPALLQDVQQAATSHGADVAAWVRQAMRHITVEDFPASWRAGDATEHGTMEAGPMTRGTTGSVSCYASMSRRGSAWRASPSTSISRVPRSSGSW